jgi:hypothetical protein
LPLCATVLSLVRTLLPRLPGNHYCS